MGLSSELRMSYSDVLWVHLLQNHYCSCISGWFPHSPQICICLCRLAGWLGKRNRCRVALWETQKWPTEPQKGFLQECKSYKNTWWYFCCHIHSTMIRIIIFCQKSTGKTPFLYMKKSKIIYISAFKPHSYCLCENKLHSSLPIY